MYVEVTCQEVLENARRKNLLWILVHLHGQMSQKVSGWTGYNILVCNEIDVRQDNIRYLPTIDAPATSLSTVHEILVRSLKIKEALGLKSIVLGRVVRKETAWRKVTEAVNQEARKEYSAAVYRDKVWKNIRDTYVRAIGGCWKKSGSESVEENSTLDDGVDDEADVDDSSDF
ncbi:hypothetical protein ACROYT_G015036 [Oculina patagonica]